jgi:3-oxoacyl-[acyl-carrier-protein] synthase III
MKIAGVSASLPSRQVDNDEILDMVKFYSKDTFVGDLNKTLRVIKTLLVRNGNQQRCWLAANEQPMELLQHCFEEALTQSGLARSDLNLLIYTGVGAAVMEPANAPFVAQRLGLSQIRNYDVIEACMGWVSALEIINGLMQSGRIQAAAIVNLEFNLIEKGPILPKNFQLQSKNELEYKFPSYTVGETAAATIVTAEAADNFSFSVVSRPDLADLCSVSLPGYRRYFHSDKLDIFGGQYQFCSFGRALHDQAKIELPKALAGLQMDQAQFKRVFVHASSKTDWTNYGQAAGIADKIHHISHRTGNLVSASIPAAIHHALCQGQLQQDDSCLFWVGSAGMSMAAVHCCF